MEENPIDRLKRILDTTYYVEYYELPALFRNFINVLEVINDYPKDKDTIIKHLVEETRSKLNETIDESELTRLRKILEE